MSLPTLAAFVHQLTGPAAIPRDGEPVLVWGKMKTPEHLAVYRDGPLSSPFLKLIERTWRWQMARDPDLVPTVGAVRLTCAMIELSAELDRTPTIEELHKLASSWPRPAWIDAPTDFESVGKPYLMHDARAIVAAWGLARAVRLPLQRGHERPRWPIQGDYAAWRDAADLAHSLRGEVLRWDGDWL